MIWFFGLFNMRFEQRGAAVERFGEKIGFLFSFFLFTTMLYFILFFLGKLSATWTYFHVMGITFSIVLVGMIFKRLLK